MGGLFNRYFALRHGFSLANEARKIVSRYENGRLAIYGLSGRGREEATNAGKKISVEAKRDVIIWASDFSRTVETAELAAKAAGIKQIYMSPDLRERDFGVLELESTDRYEEVWREDSLRRKSSYNAEPTEVVSKRLLGFVARAEYHFQDVDIVLVSHGDTLQILQAAFAGIKIKFLIILSQASTPGTTGPCRTSRPASYASSRNLLPRKSHYYQTTTIRNSTTNHQVGLLGGLSPPRRR